MLAISPHKHPLLRPHIPPTQSDFGALDSRTLASVLLVAFLVGADLIGQLADPRYPQKLNALFHEFVETGTAKHLGLSNPADLVDSFPTFFWKSVEPYIGDALGYLSLTSEGRQWIANLHSHVFAVEHRKLTSGPQLDS